MQQIDKLRQLACQITTLTAEPICIRLKGHVRLSPVITGNSVVKVRISNREAQPLDRLSLPINMQVNVRHSSPMTMWSVLMLVFLAIAGSVGTGLVQVPGHERLNWKYSVHSAKTWIERAL
jgi:hypothetical protein